MKTHIANQSQIDTAADWHTAIKDELLEVEDYLQQAVRSDVQTSFEISKRLLFAGGKRLRPALVILSSQASLAPVSRLRLTTIASTVELIHMASLIHDDVIDHSDSRRGRSTANTFWGNKISVLSGDFMLAKAFSFLAHDSDPRIMQVISDMSIRMSESEVLQAICQHSIERWDKYYWQIIRHKTAGFLSACCRCGAILADATPIVEEALAEYGMELGMAFQLTDDLLDIIGQPEVTGKPVGSDIRDGKVTLPVLLMLSTLSGPDLAHALAIIENEDPSDEELSQLCSMVSASPAIEMVQGHARSYIERAIAILDKLPTSPARESLAMLAGQIIDRSN